MDSVLRNFPYHARKEIVWKPPANLSLDSRYMLLTAAVGVVGKEKDPEWTGAELTARRHIKILGKAPPIERVSCPLKVIKTQFNVDPRRYFVPTITGKEEEFSDGREAGAFWKKQLPDLLALWQLEFEERERFDLAVKELLKRLKTGALPAFVVRAHVGGLFSVPRGGWNRVDADKIFETPFQLAWDGRLDDEAKTNWGSFLGCENSEGVLTSGVIEGNVAIAEDDLNKQGEQLDPPGTVVSDTDTEGEKKRKAKAAAETKCTEWLTRLMDDYKDPVRTKDKCFSEYKKQASGKYEIYKVEDRAFVRAWAGAVRASGNSDWSKPGPRDLTALVRWPEIGAV